MDPESRWPDHKLWEALQAVQLKEAVTKASQFSAADVTLDHQMCCTAAKPNCYCMVACQT